MLRLAVHKIASLGFEENIIFEKSRYIFKLKVVADNVELEMILAKKIYMNIKHWHKGPIF